MIFRSFKEKTNSIFLVLISVSIRQYYLIGLTNAIAADDNEAKYCKEEIFFKPYIEVYRTRYASPAFKTSDPILVDLRMYYGALLCINGPAFIYNNVEQRYNLTSVDKNITYFVNGTVQYYEHKCFIINRPANATILVAQQDVNPMSPANSSSFHRILNFPKTAMENEFLVHPFAKKVFAASLVGNSTDYRSPSLYMFSGSEFTQNYYEIMISSSFGVVGNNEWTCHDSFTNTNLFVKGAGDPKEFCRKSEDAAPSEFDKVFQRGHYKFEYKNCWEMLPLDAKIPPSSITAPIGAPPTIVGPPRADLSDDLNKLVAIGRILNPTSLGYMRPGGPGAAGLGSESQNHDLTIAYPFDFPEDTDPSIEKPLKVQKLDIAATDCEKIPDIKVACDNAKAPPAPPAGVTPVDECAFLNAILDLETKPKPPTKDPPETPPAPEPLAWKMDILNILGKIFTKVCPVINAQTVKSVSKIMETYLKGTPEPKNDFWNFIESELKHCYNDSSQMEFRQAVKQVVFDSNEYKFGTSKERQLLRKKGTEIFVKRFDGSFAEISYYEEAAEIDYEFNYAIDGQWKIFATVLGYCNKFYSIKKSSVFQRLYFLFTEDFLKPTNVQDKWISKDENSILSFIIGDIASGDNEFWLDACLESAYVHSDSEEYRAVRPVQINRFDDKGVFLTEDKGEMNYFITTPIHS